MEKNLHKNEADMLHKLNEADLNYLVGDLKLSKLQFELSASGFKPFVSQKSYPIEK